MNTEIKSLISKIKVNKVFKDFSQNKKNKQIKMEFKEILLNLVIPRI